MSRFATRFKRHQHTENITDDDEFPIHLFNYPWVNYDRGRCMVTGLGLV